MQTKIRQTVAESIPPGTETVDSTHDDHAHRLPSLPRFRLRTLLLVMASVSVLFMILQRVGTAASVLIIWALLLAAAHVLANAWGSRRRAGRTSLANSGEQQPVHPLPATAHAPATQLREPTSISKIMLVFAGVGATCGGLLGGFVLGTHYWQQGGTLPVMLGSVSAAIIGGFLGFLVSSFVQVAARAFGEAAADSRR